jgi:hypothetical protein
MMDEILLGEELALESALRFLNGWPVWNDDITPLMQDDSTLDGYLVDLTRMVLMGPATVYVATGKTV